MTAKLCDHCHRPRELEQVLIKMRGFEIYCEFCDDCIVGFCTVLQAYQSALMLPDPRLVVEAGNA